jgi:hypothetical protein
MKYYKINTESNNCQWIMPQVDESKIPELLNFNCSTKIKELENMEWYVFNPKQNKANFFTIGIGGVLVFDKHVYESQVYSSLEMAGEIIPISIGDETLYILNVLECVNALNKSKSKWDIYPNGQKGRILQYSFYKDRVSESTIFKIPETAATEVFAYSDLKEPIDEFYYQYHKEEFTGLSFEVVF